MAFRFRSKSSLPISNGPTPNEPRITNQSETISPKLTNVQLNKLTKVYPPWLKNKSSPQQLPGIYQGVLGQVQLQPGMSLESQLANGQRLANRPHQMDYMNRFTDTERVHQLLSASHLSDETLATIWAHVNQTFPGKLTNREVCLALALIAVFQRFEDPKDTGGTFKSDPFSLVRAEKKPPVPVLYPNHNGKSIASSRPITRPMTNSNSIPEKLSGSSSSGALLVDFGDDSLIDNNKVDNFHASTNSVFTAMITRGNVKTSNNLLMSDHQLNLIDIMDGDKFELELLKLAQVWLRFLSAMRTIFKRSFDVLNVDHSRQSAIEALKSPKGKQFIKQLCLCYPLGHNIKFKIDQLNKLKRDKIEKLPKEQKKPNELQYNGLFDKQYIIQIDDLMNSIKEYWAVLINLFHESGQTKFIELIMDGLNYKKPTVSSRNIEELADELNSRNKSHLCSVCHTNFYLTHGDNLTIEVSQEDIELVSEQKELLSEDKQYYYHVRCANFWLNNVDPEGELPFQKKPEDGILSPESC